MIQSPNDRKARIECFHLNSTLNDKFKDEEDRLTSQLIMLERRAIRKSATLNDISNDASATERCESRHDLPPKCPERLLSDFDYGDNECFLNVIDLECRIHNESIDDEVSICTFEYEYNYDDDYSTLCSDEDLENFQYVDYNYNAVMITAKSHVFHPHFPGGRKPPRAPRRRSTLSTCHESNHASNNFRQDNLNVNGMQQPPIFPRRRSTLLTSEMTEEETAETIQYVDKSNAIIEKDPSNVPQSNVYQEKLKAPGVPSHWSTNHPISDNFHNGLHRSPISARHGTKSQINEKENARIDSYIVFPSKTIHPVKHQTLRAPRRRSTLSTHHESTN